MVFGFLLVLEGTLIDLLSGCESRHLLVINLLAEWMGHAIFCSCSHASLSVSLLEGCLGADDGVVGRQ